MNLKNLEILNLSSNKIESLKVRTQNFFEHLFQIFKEITNLQCLPNLKYLYLKDPQYGQNPVTLLCNYSLYMIYHLPSLVSLDTLPISNKIVKELADVNDIFYLIKFLNCLNSQQ